MPFVPVTGAVQAEMRYTQDGQKVENVFWFSTVTPGAFGPDKEAVATMLFDWWDAHVKTIQAANVTLREIYVTDQDAPNSGSFTLTAGLPASGGNPNTPLPNSVTLCVSFRTGTRGRSYRGRAYHIGLTENQRAGNYITPAAIASVTAAYDSLVNESTLAGLPMVIVSRFSGGLPRAAGIFTQVTDALVVDDIIDSQRRRLPGRGA